jgi:hypothetical protein
LKFSRTIIRLAGYSKDEILKIAEELASDMINVEVEEKEQFFRIKLKWAQPLSPTIERSHAIFKIKYTGEKNEQFETKIRDNQHKDIEQAIKGFGTDLINSLIQKLNLEQHYKNKYADTDTNVLYKVKKFYETKSGNANYERELFMYQAQKLRELIPAYEPLLGMILDKETQHENEEGMEEFMHAIADRFNQLLFAYDMISGILGTGETDPNVEFVFNFHLWHFISLVKSLGDNLAWMLKLYLKLEFEDRDIDLLRDHFRNTLKNANSRMASLIYDDPQFSKFETLNEYRDILQHRHKIHTRKVMSGYPPKHTKIVIPANPESLVRGKNVRRSKAIESTRVKSDALINNRSEEYHDSSNDEPTSHIQVNRLEVPSDERDSIDPLEFCKEKIDFISNVYKKVLDRIRIELLKKSISG